MEFWGFRPNLGRVWTALYLSASPRTAADLCAELSLSTGAVSMAVNELVRWRAIRRRNLSGDRREYFEVEPDVWASLARVLEQREVQEIDEVASALVLAERRYAQEEVLARGEGHAEAATEAGWRRRRVQELQEVALTGRDLLRLLLSDAGPLVRRVAPEGGNPRVLIPRAPEEDP